MQVALETIGDLLQSADPGRTYLDIVAKVIEFSDLVTILSGFPWFALLIYLR